MWFNTGNAGTSDGSYATASVTSSGITHYLKATNFGFAIPGGSVIEGIVVEIERKGSGTNVVKDNRVRIVKGGAIGTEDKANASAWPTSDAYESYGAFNDLWGEAWTVADINSSGFGVAISAIGLAIGIGSIDHVRVTVYYS